MNLIPIIFGAMGFGLVPSGGESCNFLKFSEDYPDEMYSVKLRENDYNIPIEIEMNFRKVDKGSEETILLISGLCDSSFGMLGMLNSLDTLTDVNVVAFDVAWGKSEIIPFDYNVEQQKLLVNSVIDFLNNDNDLLSSRTETFHVVGHSMGAKIGFSVVRDFFKSDENKNYDIGSYTGLTPASLPRGIFDINSFDILTSLPSLFYRHINEDIARRITLDYIRREFLSVGSSISDFVLNNYFDNAYRNGGLERISRVYSYIQKRYGDEEYEDFEDIDIPMQFITAEEDSLYPGKDNFYYLKELYREREDIEVSMYTGTNHLITIQRHLSVSGDIKRLISRRN